MCAFNGFSQTERQALGIARRHIIPPYLEHFSLYRPLLCTRDLVTLYQVPQGIADTPEVARFFAGEACYATSWNDFQRLFARRGYSMHQMQELFKRFKRRHAGASPPPPPPNSLTCHYRLLCARRFGVCRIDWCLGSASADHGSPLAHDTAHSRLGSAPASCCSQGLKPQARHTGDALPGGVPFTEDAPD